MTNKEINNLFEFINFAEDMIYDKCDYKMVQYIMDSISNNMYCTIEDYEEFLRMED